MRLPRGEYGTTLPEILISGSLLLLLSALFFQGVLPALQREDWFANRQSVITGYLAAKERLAGLLRSSLLVPVADQSELTGQDQLLVEFHRQNRFDTSNFAQMGVIDRRELPTYEELSLIHI